MTKLKDLEPSYATGCDGKRFLIFTCPKCFKHGIAVQIAGEGVAVFDVVGEKDFSDLTLIPSVAFVQEKDKDYRKSQHIAGKHYAIPEHCEFHFHVRSGEIVPCYNEVWI